MNKKEKISYIIKELNKLFPEAHCELDFETPFQLMVAVIMSAQTTDIQVNKINKEFFKKLKNPEDVLVIWEENIKTEISKIWLHRNKSKFIYNAGKILAEKYNSNIPKDINELQKLPWVWVKTAKVILSVLYKMPYLAVDTHVHRVLNRLGLVNTKYAEETDKKTDKLFSKWDKIKLHHTLVFFGRYHCTAKNPKCDKCPFEEFCKYFNKKNK